VHTLAAAFLAAFYANVQRVVREATGADRVVVFDHTLRTSGVSSLNSLDGKAAAGAVIRVHGDYTHSSGPARLRQLIDDGTVAADARVGAATGGANGGAATGGANSGAATGGANGGAHDGAAGPSREGPSRFAFVNWWQSIDANSPVLQHPLALCRPRSVAYSESTWDYLMYFATRVGRNLAVDGTHAQQHEWGYYPRMGPGEAILFVTFDAAAVEGGAVGVVHTAFDDDAIDGAGVPRRSVECRTVAIWDD
jgi:hypothetical protein